MRQFRLINKIFCCELSVKMDFNPPCEQGLVIIQKLPEKPIDVIIVQSGIREINLVLALPCGSQKLRFVCFANLLLTSSIKILTLSK